MSIDANDVVKELRNSCGFALILCVTWVVLSESYALSYKQRAAFENLLAYVQLRDAAITGNYPDRAPDSPPSPLPPPDSSKVEAVAQPGSHITRDLPCERRRTNSVITVGKTTTETMRVGDRPSGMSRLSPTTIEMRMTIRPPAFQLLAPWDPSKRVELAVGNSYSEITYTDAGHESHRAHHFCVDIEDWFLPFNNYLITHRDYRRRAYLDSNPDMASNPANSASQANSSASAPIPGSNEKYFVGQSRGNSFLSEVPVDWQISRSMLIAAGTKEPDIRTITTQDPGTQSLIAKHYSPGGETAVVGGVAVPLRLVPLTAAVLLTLAACHLLGSWSALRQARNAPFTQSNKSGWIMLDTSPGFAGHLSLAAAFLLSCAILSIPAYAAYRTNSLRLSVPSTAQTELIALLAALTLFAVVLVAAMIEQFRLRRALRDLRNKKN